MMAERSLVKSPKYPKKTKKLQASPQYGIISTVK